MKKRLIALITSLSIGLMPIIAKGNTQYLKKQNHSNNGINQTELFASIELQQLGFGYIGSSKAAESLYKSTCYDNGFYTPIIKKTPNGFEYYLKPDFEKLNFEKPFTLKILKKGDLNKNKVINDSEAFKLELTLELEGLKKAFPNQFKNIEEEEDYKEIYQ